MTTDEIIRGVNLLAELVQKAKQAYDAHRAAAIAAGVPESALKTSDAIFARDDEDPLPKSEPQPEPPSPPPTPPTPPPPPEQPGFMHYAKWIVDPGDAPLMNQDHVYHRRADQPQDGLVFIWKGGPINLGIGDPPRVSDLLRVVTK